MRRAIALLGAVYVAVACASRGPEPIAYGQVNCDFCRMTISDPRFGSELVTSKGKVHQFDSIECLASYVLSEHASATARGVWVSDFRHPGTLLAADSARFVRLGGGRSPMGRGWAAVRPDDAAADLRAPNAPRLTWHEVQDAVAREGLPHDTHELTDAAER